ncbi:hypothetical protein DPMN_160290 [Dreissena polymorpha]|uniref:Uncharacterized protein n=2 Tax=Dreissena polymorpha TaxID=45954 RepID=A0A9D4IPZ7_DREPO|nr:hypothetical protein DPMN_160290 [Dreissena polymorpha]
MLNVYGQSTTKSSGETSAITRDSNAIVESWFNIVKSKLLCKKGGVRVGQFVKLVFTDVQGRLREYAGDSELEGLKTTNEGVADARESWSKKRKPVKKGPHYYAANATAVPKQPKESKSGAQIKTSTPTEAECPDKIEATNLKLGTEEIPEKVIEKNISECFTPLMTSTPKKKARKKQYELSEGNGTQDNATSKKKSRKKQNKISEDVTQDIATCKTKPRSSAANKDKCLPVDKKRRRSQQPGTRLGKCVLPPGLKNTLNTCWLISTVQAFASLERFNLKFKKSFF